VLKILVVVLTGAVLVGMLLGAVLMLVFLSFLF
jgi:hypothetical protein